MDSSHLVRTSDSTTDQKEALKQALVEGNIQLVEDMLQKHPYLINCQLTGDGFSASPLVIVEGILQKHPELTNCEFKGKRSSASPLVFACDLAGHQTAYDIVDLLLKRGADPNCVGYRGCRGFGFERVPPLMIVAMEKVPKFTELLLNAGANVNQTNSKGQTTLHFCCCERYDRNEIMKILLSYNADVSVKDIYGRTALHYVCEYKTKDTVDLLLGAGAEMNIADGSGFTELQLAAQSNRDIGSKVQLLLDSCPYPTETIIEAYETSAWSLLLDIDFGGDSECLLDPIVDCMRKATLMRQEHRIPKNVSCPLECYDFAKEWETIKDLLKYVNSCQQLKVQAMLTRERIDKGRHREEQLRQYLSFYHKLIKTREQLNALLMHHLDLFEESMAVKNIEGYMVLSRLTAIFRPWFGVMLNKHQLYGFKDLDTASIVRIIRVGTDSCQEMKQILDGETVGLGSNMFLYHFVENIFAVTGIIMKLYKRNRSISDTMNTEESLAKEMLKEVVNKVGDVVLQTINFRRPVLHIIFMKHMQSAVLGPLEHKPFTDYDICKVLIDCINDIDATDHGGNTLVLLVAEQIQFDCQDPCDPNLLNILDFLVDQGAYLYARNRERKTVIDYLTDAVEKTGSDDENLKRTLDMLKKKVPSLQTLAAVRAKDMNPVSDIPERFKRFIDIH